jgi:hypothetical protein
MSPSRLRGSGWVGGWNPGRRFPLVMQGGEAERCSSPRQREMEIRFCLLCVRSKYKNRWILGWGYRGLVCCSCKIHNIWFGSITTQGIIDEWSMDRSAVRSVGIHGTILWIMTTTASSRSFMRWEGSMNDREKTFYFRYANHTCPVGSENGGRAGPGRKIGGWSTYLPKVRNLRELDEA